MGKARHPRIVQITGLTYPDSAPGLAALDTDGRVWIADLDELDHGPAWQEVYPIPADESTGEPEKAPTDPAERAGLCRELESILYHASRDLHFMAQEIEDAIERLNGGPETDVAAVAVDIIRLASRICAQAGDLGDEQND